MTQDAEERITMGRVSGLFGIKGWVKVYSHTRPMENILQYRRWWIERDNTWREFTVVQGQKQGKGLIARLEGIDDTDAAASLIDGQIAVKRSDMPMPADGQVYWSDLIGLQVINRQGDDLGEIHSLLETGANDVLVVEDKGKEVRRLIPFVRDEYVLKIDLDAKCVEVDWETDW